MVRVLVAGANSFIGQRLVSLLNRERYWVRAVDVNPSSSAASTASEFQLLDLRTWEACLHATKDVDEVYSLAAHADDDKFRSSSTVVANESSIHNQCLEAARQNGVRRYLYVSSKRVYPARIRISAVPVREEHALDNGERDPEGVAHLTCERLCLQYRESYGLETRIVRMHDIYGPLADWMGGKETLVSALCRKIAAAQIEGLREIEIAGDGAQKGSFLYVDDCVAGLHNIMRSDCRVPVNLDDSRVLSISELTGLIASIADVEIKHRFLPSAERGCCCHFDTTLLKQSVRWKPETTVEEGVKHTYRWVAEQVRELASEFSFGIAHFHSSR